tara:strand:- start:2109 stop:2672 length:564 start_codon:yes stop_codon:yes gene_type:complete
MVFCCFTTKREDKYNNTVTISDSDSETSFVSDISNNRLTKYNLLLHSATWKNTPKFIPDIKYGKVIKVYDGDTITVAAQPYPNSDFFRFSIRLFGIDTPELISKDAVEKKAAKFVKYKLETLILYKFVHIDVMHYDKYGRIVAKIFINTMHTDVSTWLLENNYALKYDGGTKPNADWDKIISVNTNS